VVVEVDDFAGVKARYPPAAIITITTTTTKITTALLTAYLNFPALEYINFSILFDEL